MKYVTLLLQVGVLYVFSLVGTWIQGVFHLSMPGSLIGMLMLFLLLSIRILPLKWFEEGAEKLIVFLPLFLIPSTTGLVEYGSFLFSKEYYISFSSCKYGSNFNYFRVYKSISSNIKK